MTDQKLLELAAKAVGLEVFSKDLPGNAETMATAGLYTRIGYWNPLADDGDAFRLMVALNLDVVFDGPSGMRVDYVNDCGSLCTVEQLVLVDLAEAVRRTIVRAAAELAGSK